MSVMKAIVVDPESIERLVIREVDAPIVSPSEALVRVSAISLNRGEVHQAMAAEAGWRPGWDLAGVIEQPAADGTGPGKDARVVGMVPFAAWAEFAAVSTTMMAEIPEAVSFAQAATLPVAGLTSLRSLEKGGFLLNRNVLITGASGGVGHMAIQLARQAGARVVGVIRNPDHEALVKAMGAHYVALGEDLATARQFGPYHLILDSVGGQSLGNALSMLAPEGVCVNFGASSSSEVTFIAEPFFIAGGATLYGLALYNELPKKPGAEDLGNLARMVVDGRLKPLIGIEVPWTEIANVAQSLLERRMVGKAVLHIAR